VIVAVVNPASGAGKARERVRAVVRACADSGKPLEIIETTGPGDVRRAAAEALGHKPEAVAIVGGDGTIGEVCGAWADVAPDERPPVVNVPSGRGNSFYMALLSDAPWEEYVRLAITRPYVKRVDVGRVEETADLWALGVSVGYLHDCVAAARHFPALRGRALYAAAGAYAAARVKPFRIEVHVDGRPVFAGRSVMAAVGGGPFRGGRLQLFPTSDLTDGRLDACIVEAVGAVRFAEILRAAGGGRHVEEPDVHCFTGEQIRITGDDLRCEVDGTLYALPGDAVTLTCLQGFLPVSFPLWNWDDVRPI
jgi:diacylglycerol kinase (ATP)